jgi:signal peptidase I
VLIEKVSRWFRAPKRWDVAFLYNENGPIAKRVVGLPGETISITNNWVLANGTPLARPAHLTRLKYYPYGNLAQPQGTNCGAAYYLLGDESVDSYDSRFTGPVPASSLHGRVWLIVWPPARIGFVR